MYGKILLEVDRFIELIPKYEMNYCNFKIIHTHFSEALGFTARIHWQPDFKDGEFVLIIGETLMTTPLRICMAGIAHEFGHLSTGNAYLIIKHTNNDSPKEVISKIRKGAEFQADIFATRLLAIAGYEPLSMAKFLRGVSMRNNIDPDEEDDEHPSINKRIEVIKKACTKLF